MLIPLFRFRRFSFLLALCVTPGIVSVCGCSFWFSFFRLFPCFLDRSDFLVFHYLFEHFMISFLILFLSMLPSMLYLFMFLLNRSSIFLFLLPYVFLSIFKSSAMPLFVS